MSLVVPRQLHFTVEEYRARLENVQEHMGRAGLAALLLHHPENIAWMSGFWHDGFFAYHALVVPAQGDPVLIERALEDPVAQEMSWIADRRSYLDGDDAPALAVSAVEEVTADGARVGVELSSPYLPARRHLDLVGRMPGREVVSHEEIVEEAMRIKSPAELDYLRRAGRTASAAVAAGLAVARPGASEMDVAAAIALAQAEHDHDAFLGGAGGTICTGWRTIQLHGQQTPRVIEPGDRIRLELPGIYRQYWAKQMRSAVIGEPDDAFRRAYDVVRGAQDAGIAAMGPGVPFARVAGLCRRPVLDAGLVENYENRVGYGVGLQFHPTSGDFDLDIDHRSDRILEPGMVFHMLLFAGGAAISETVAITDDGHEVLTSGSRDLAVPTW